jgi:hypothetical protein
VQEGVHGRGVHRVSALHPLSEACEAFLPCKAAYRQG